MANNDFEASMLIVQGDSTIVGDLVLQTGTIPSGPNAGRPIYAGENALRANGTVISSSNPLPVTDAAAEASLSSLVTNLGTLSNAGAALSTIASAQGAGANGISQLTGGSGILGWLSGIFQKLSSALTTNDGGTAASGVNQPTGGAGLTGWLSGIYAAVTGTQITKPGVQTIIPLDNPFTGAAGTPINILNAGHVTGGGYIIPLTAGGNVNLLGNAGTVAGGNNIPVGVGQAFVIAPNAGAVSFVSTTGTVAFAGNGYQ